SGLQIPFIYSSTSPCGRYRTAALKVKNPFWILVTPSFRTRFGILNYEMLKQVQQDANTLTA
ncbi:hypothetical protein, partial [Sphingobacterium hungaricum]